MGIENQEIHRLVCIEGRNRREAAALTGSRESAHWPAEVSQTRAQTSSESEGDRRVISRWTASLVVAIPGAMLLGLGLFLISTAPHPGDLIGNEYFIQRYCGLVASTTGSAALAASMVLAASSLLKVSGKQSRLAVYLLGLATLAAVVALF